MHRKRYWDYYIFKTTIWKFVKIAFHQGPWWNLEPCIFWLTVRCSTTKLPGISSQLRQHWQISNMHFQPCWSFLFFISSSFHVWVASKVANSHVWIRKLHFHPRWWLRTIKLNCLEFLTYFLRISWVTYHSYQYEKQIRM